MTRYSAEERAAIARGEFFTTAELAARPGLGHSVRAATPAVAVRRDPNSRPVSAEAKAMVEVCAYCYEPGDERSNLVETARHDLMHPECDRAWEAERHGRQ